MNCESSSHNMLAAAMAASPPVIATPVNHRCGVVMPVVAPEKVETTGR
jgi:hypothetical protein